jgi:hypothetical protein
MCCTFCCRGTLRNTGNMMFIAALMGKYADSANRQKHICWTRMQMRYITGNLPNTGQHICQQHRLVI